MALSECDGRSDTPVDHRRRCLPSNAVDDALPYIVPVIADVLESTLPYRPLSRKEAELLARLGRIAEGLSGVTRYLIARQLAAREDGESARDIEDFLAFAPWRGGGDRYARAFAAGRISTFHTYLGSGITPEAVDLAVGIGSTR